jgi:16S rRNA (uracil1498-N3)-methyltransferase
MAMKFFLRCECSKIPKLQGMDWLLVPTLSMADRTVALHGDTVKHCHALRLKPGDDVGLVNGRGIRARGSVLSVERKQVVVSVMNLQEEPPSHDIVLCLAVLDSRERLEFAIEKTTELGVTRIIVLSSDRSQHRNVRLDRLEQKVFAAVMQSGRAWIPVITGPLNLDEALAAVRSHTIIVGSQQGASPSALRANCAIFVGPEGGFSQREINVLAGAGAQPWRVGLNRLRTETAAVVLTAAVIHSLDAGETLTGDYKR